MNKVRKFVLIPLALLLGAIVIAALILSFVRVNPLVNNFDGYDRVALLNSSDGNEFPEITVSQEGEQLNTTENVLSEGIENLDFSIMQGILEGKFSYSPKLKRNEDGEELTFSSASIKAYGALEGEYVLKFYYDTARTIEVEGKKIIFDRLLVKLSESNGEIRDMECVPYLDYNIDNESMESEYDENGRIGSAYYTANALTVKLNTSRFLIDLKEFKTLYA